jgi:hypothetical protein
MYLITIEHLQKRATAWDCVQFIRFYKNWEVRSQVQAGELIGL